VKSRTILKTR